ncbi:hypothetical protein [Marinigracilibium pacificum]|uniref:Response regulatory domain-containing protein n=1 Tax=Marinigracilibium pacificum TaxID=2729599 RepID=A0A848J4Q9_9BACT|nr:hypothetical protein [Marinigracilibium pacificum]NMM49339.1 hypothetical protein [Marinigracilibium pacificum]
MIFINHNKEPISTQIIEYLNKIGFNNLLIIDEDESVSQELIYELATKPEDINNVMSKYQWESELFIFIEPSKISFKEIIGQCFKYQIPLIAINSSFNVNASETQLPFFYKHISIPDNTLNSSDQQTLLNILEMI